MAVKLDESTRERLQRLAKARDRSAHWMMREAIAQYVEREERREAFRQDGVRAWEEYQATGLHLTEAEADVVSLPTSRPAATRNRPNATPDLVARCPAGRRAPPPISGREERAGRAARGDAHPRRNEGYIAQPGVGRPVPEMDPEFRAAGHSLWRERLCGPRIVSRARRRWSWRYGTNAKWGTERRPRAPQRAAVSSQIVTGPSFTSVTRISAPKTPVATATPCPSTCRAKCS